MDGRENKKFFKMMSSGQDIVFTVSDHNSGVLAVVPHRNGPINIQAEIEKEVKDPYLLV